MVAINNFGSILEFVNVAPKIHLNIHKMLKIKFCQIANYKKASGQADYQAESLYNSETTMVLSFNPATYPVPGLFPINILNHVL